MRLNLLITAIAVSGLAGCGAAPHGPEPVPVDRVNCARCGMLISSEANAAQSRATGQATRFYDDIGCLAADPAARTEETQRYVRLVSGGWATTEAAHFARSQRAQTPMDYGILAFGTAEEARANDADKQARNWLSIVTLAETR